MSQCVHARAHAHTHTQICHRDAYKDTIRRATLRFLCLCVRVWLCLHPHAWSVQAAAGWNCVTEAASTVCQAPERASSAFTPRQSQALRQAPGAKCLIIPLFSSLPFPLTPSLLLSLSPAIILFCCLLYSSNHSVLSAGCTRCKTVMFWIKRPSSEHSKYSTDKTV